MAQEAVAPINYNPFVHSAAAKRAAKAQKKTALSLPFFEDFTNTDVLPDPGKWVDDEVYINNTMCAAPISRGVATFDALNSMGLPYDSTNNYDYEYADSLTSQPIDLSTHVAGDSVYLSFFYQPAGNGFYPTATDSLYLFLRADNGDWIRTWGVPGNTIQPFIQVMIPVADSSFFYNGFQFRFVNIAAFNYSDAIWNVDYIKMDANRNMYDTLINDVGFTTDPSFLLNDYSFMPYRQFMSNPAGERATQFTDSIRNNDQSYQSVNYGYTARETTTNTTLFSSNIATISLPPNQTKQLTYASYTVTVPQQGPYDKVVFENSYFMQALGNGDPTDNDTIVREQIFDNYLAYDDGTAEKSYFLNLFASLPGIIEVEYHLNQPDTLRGMAIYFGRQVSLAFNKFFSIAIYKTLAGVNGNTTDQLLHQEDLLIPSYVDTINHFWVYRLNTPVPLDAGIFYAGTVQPANSGSDSLYIGLDVNRVGSNHVFYNVLQAWEPSQITGALMMRPLLGQPVENTAVSNVAIIPATWAVSPNPATNEIKVTLTDAAGAVCALTDASGRQVITQQVKSGQEINIASLAPGVYFLNLTIAGIPATPKKIVKL